MQAHKQARLMQRHTAYMVVCSARPLLYLKVLKVVDAVKERYLKLARTVHTQQWYGIVTPVKDDCEKTL